jgi:hypothetical protein
MISKFSACVALTLLSFFFFHQPSVQAAATPMVISEIQIAGVDSTGVTNDKLEFVELHNQSGEAVDVTGWKMQYFASSRSAADMQNGASVASSGREVALSGNVPAYGTILLSSIGYQAGALVYFDTSSSSTGWFAQSGGHVRLVNPNKNVIDHIGWGSAAQPEGTAIATIAAGKSAERYVDCSHNFLIDTDNNRNDFAVVAAPSPGALNASYIDDCTVLPPATIPEDEPGQGAGPPDESTCEGIVITEILPNPDGTDVGHEFIELYNPTDTPLPLAGCSLQTSGSSKVYAFGDEELNPHEYRAVYDSQTGLTLPNTAGGTVWLLSSTSELQAIAYQAGLADDQVWAVDNATWQGSYQPTPNAANVIIAVKPCPAGQERSLDTGQCRTVAKLAVAIKTTAALAACSEGQERNPTTNRCRSLASTVATLTSCKEGQERNPETNRCRTLASAESSLKPCDPGQERSPDTNRCRKVSAVAGAATTNVKDVYSGSIIANPRWWLVGMVVLAATSYGIYEWRKEIVLIVRKITNR